MTRRRWVSPFALGMAMAVVVEAGIGLLLFVSPGLLPALTVILAVVLGSLGLGLASRPVGRASRASTRWRWFLAVGSLLVAAVVALGWTFQDGSPEGLVARGLHLAGLVAFPLYALGACLATVVHPRDGAGSGAAAALGGVAGVLAMGVVLVPRFEPVSVYLFCILCLSVAALERQPA